MRFLIVVPFLLGFLILFSPGCTRTKDYSLDDGVTYHDVITYHNDNARTGQNLAETILKHANVNPGAFGKVSYLAADGRVDAQPLYLSSVDLSVSLNVLHPVESLRNILYVVTEHASVYAFDADRGSVLWKVSLLGAGETTSDDRGCPTSFAPEIGIMATPVIDRRTRAQGSMYVVAMSKDRSGNYHQRLHALDVATGVERFGGPVEIQASYPGTGDNSQNGRVIFDPAQYTERAGLLLLNGVVYTAWTSHCDLRPYTGWIIGYDQSTLKQASVLNLTPNGNQGAIWMSGAGLAADSESNIYALAGNGTFDDTLDSRGFPSRGDFGNSFVQISTTNKKLALADYFESFDQDEENAGDEDLGSGGVLVLPDTIDSSGKTRHLALGAGKDATIYVVERENMGKYDADGDHVYQRLGSSLGGGVWATPAYFNQTVYYGAHRDNLRAFPISNAQLSPTPSSQTRNTFPYPGTTPSISANGMSDGIVWAIENGTTAALHAYDAADLSHELYNSNQAANGRDHFGPGNKFVVPTVANGKVYVATGNGVAVFGRLP